MILESFEKFAHYESLLLMLISGFNFLFQIRFEKCLPRDQGSILYCTTGIALRKIMSDPEVEEFSHIIIDEVRLG